VGHLGFTRIFSVIISPASEDVEHPAARKDLRGARDVRRARHFFDSETGKTAQANL